MFKYILILSIVLTAAVSNAQTSAAISSATSEVVVNAYPNPAINNLTVSATGISESFVVRLTDVLGKVVFEEVSSGTKKIDVSDYKNGVYLVSIFNEGDLIQTKRIVIKH